MVMKRNMMRRNLLKSILRSLGRYLAIVAIIALGCGIFVGLKVTKNDMLATGQEYMDSQNMFDLQLLSTYGWGEEQVRQIAQLDGVADAEGAVYLDVFAGMKGDDENVYRFHTIPESVNRVYLLTGRMPEKPDECLVDGEYYGEEMLGQKIIVSANNDEAALDSLNYTTYTVVGCISTPLYMDITRPSTTLGSGSVLTYIYVSPEALDVDYYTEIYVTMEGSWENYTDAYDDAANALAEQLKMEIEPLAQERFEQLLADTEASYAQGLAEYEDGLAEYESGKAEAQQQLADALKELEDAQKEINDGWLVIGEGEVQITEAQKQLDDAKAKLDAGTLELEASKSAAYTQLAEAQTALLEKYKQVTDGLNQVNDGLTQIDDGICQIDDGLDQISESLPLLELMVDVLQTSVELTQSAIDAAEKSGDETLLEKLRTQLTEQTAELEEYQTQLESVLTTQTELQATREDLVKQRTELEATHKQLTDAKNQVDLGFLELESNQLAAENQFAAAESTIKAGYLELEAGQAELEAKKAELEAGKQELTEGQAQLDEGRAEYEKGKAEAEAELADAEAKLSEGAQQLADARRTIDEMAAPGVYVMNRNTNAGYVALDSNSDIVSGVARVIPAFFLLIAALVCITTVTRMIEEERTQVGTLKALGYSNFAIMGKYLWYSGSAAIVGCVLGIGIGSVFFPNLLWNAYGIIFNIRPDVVLLVDWKLSLLVAFGYIAVSTLVTWLCCRRTLREVPSELIRPRAPAAGKKTLLEYLPFWRKLSFLNKVMLRNVVRYRQRLLMMLVGIGGCTALLLTGFGMRDTIVDIANVQFENVNHFDLQIYFSDGRDDGAKEAFLQELKNEGITDEAGFFYQTSVELEYDSAVRDIYLISADDGIKDYISFNWVGEEQGMPDVGEAFLSAGITEILGIGLGDTVTVRNSDMQTLTLTVAGIYENHIYNYVFVTPETVQEQWGSTPLDQMAFILVDEGSDVHEASAKVSTFDDVINVTVCEDTASMFDSMMDAMNLLLLVVIICAGILGAIVLYNLTNININERIREIATIKVLGFNAAETSAYVFKENILLTLLGTVFGLALGRWFLDFVMDNIKIDMVWFKVRLTFPSYIYAVLLTLLCALLVDLIFHRRLDKINMAEALKSVE